MTSTPPAARIVRAIASLALFAAVPAVAGPLTPPAGPIAPTMKTLDQIEPRRAIQSLPGDEQAMFIITQPGSYYLAGDVSIVGPRGGIKILVSDVTIDFNGFSLRGGWNTGTNDGITATDRRNIVIRNGTIKDFGGDGIELLRCNSVRIEDVTVDQNFGRGIVTGGVAAISRVTLKDNRSGGIVAADASMVTDSLLTGNLGQGVVVGAGSTVARCNIRNSYSTGILVGDSSMVLDCNVSFPGDEGIVVTNGCTVRGCSVDDARLEGIKVTGSRNCIEGNHTFRSWINIHVLAGGNAIIRNVYDAERGVSIVGGNQAPTAAASAATNPFANVWY